MRWAALHLRSRNAPAAVAVAAGLAVLSWTLWSVFSDERDAGPQLVVLTVLTGVLALTATLGGPDDALDRTAALPWWSRRTAHLLAAVLVVSLPLLATPLTGARFGPAATVLRDAAGLLGLTALGAALLGTPKAWFLPLGWTLAAVQFPHPGTVLGRVLTWQAQAPGDRTAGAVAGLLALGGLVAYAVCGPLPRPPAEAGQE